MAIDKTGKTLINFNVKNGQYAINNGSGYDAPQSLTWLTKFAKEKNLSTQPLYGDGELQTTLVNDKGFTGTIGMTAQDIDYNKALGFAKAIDGGDAEVEQLSVIDHAIYFETEYAGNDGIPKTKKVWVFGVETQAPSETYDQNTEDINESTVEYAITVKGINLKDTDGTTDYVDPETGQNVKVFTYSKVPGDADYATFGDAVPTPKLATT